MRLLLLSVICFLLTTSLSLAQTRYLTVENRLACLTKSDYDKINSYLAADDRDAANLLVKSGRCLVMKGGVEVQLMDAGILGPSQIRVIGTETTVWTASSSIKKK